MKTINIKNVQIKVSPTKYKDNTLRMELSFTTHAGDLTTYNWPEVLRTDIDGQEVKLTEYNYLRKSEHHPILEIFWEADREALRSGRQLSLNFSGLAGTNKKISWKLKKVNEFLFPAQMSVIANDLKGKLWLLTAQDKKNLEYVALRGDFVKISNNSWLNYDQEKGVIDRITLDADFEVSSKSTKTLPYLQDIAYFELENLLLAINEKRDNILAINLENGETILSYKDLIQSANNIEVIGNQLFVTENNTIKVINFQSFMLAKDIALASKKITDLKKSQDEKYLFAIDEDKTLKILNVNSLEVVKEIYYSKDYSYDPVLQSISVLNTEGTVISIYNLPSNTREDIRLEHSLKDLVVVPNTKLIYGNSADNYDLVLINSESGEAVRRLPDMALKNLDDNYVIINND
ncbi:MAG: hypothetical protein ACOWWO_15275 [Peptococcaceae bacterium]